MVLSDAYVTGRLKTKSSKNALSFRHLVRLRLAPNVVYSLGVNRKITSFVLFDSSSFIRILSILSNIKTRSQTSTDFGGDGQIIGCAATGDRITIVHLTRRAKQAAHLDFEGSETRC